MFYNYKKTVDSQGLMELKKAIASNNVQQVNSCLDFVTTDETKGLFEFLFSYDLKCLRGNNSSMVIHDGIIQLLLPKAQNLKFEAKTGYGGAYMPEALFCISSPDCSGDSSNELIKIEQNSDKFIPFCQYMNRLAAYVVIEALLRNDQDIFSLLLKTDYKTINLVENIRALIQNYLIVKKPTNQEWQNLTRNVVRLQDVELQRYLLDMVRANAKDAVPANCYPVGYALQALPIGDMLPRHATCAPAPALAAPVPVHGPVAPVLVQPGVIELLNTLPNCVSDYRDNIAKERSIQEKIAALNNALGIEKVNEALQPFEDPVTLEVPNCPVVVHGHVYDLNSLMALPQAPDGSRTLPTTREQFYLIQIQPDRGLRNSIIAVIEKLEAEAKLTQAHATNLATTMHL
jgi:hypothetical protein